MRNDYKYIFSKVNHMKRMGLVSQNSVGFGKHGGACPDWLATEQKEKEKRRAKIERQRVAA